MRTPAAGSGGRGGEVTEVMLPPGAAGRALPAGCVSCQCTRVTCDLLTVTKLCGQFRSGLQWKLLVTFY